MANTISNELDASGAINTAIQNIVSEVESISKKIEGVREPNPELLDSNDKLAQQVHDNRGRPLFYKYIGSGIGRGCYVEVEDGSIKLDLINGIGINILGHSHPKVIAATLRGAISDVVVQGNLQPNKELIDIGSKLIEIASRQSSLKHVWVTTSGSMAIENALKMCRQKTNAA